MQCSWSQVVSAASQLLQQILAQSVSSFTSFKAVIREQPSPEIDGTMRTAFHNLKEMITSEQVLTQYDPTLPQRLLCEVSPVGIGAVSSHVVNDGTEQPIAFASRTLRKTEQG